MISTIEPVINHLSLPSKTNSLLILEKWINSICDTFSISEEQYGNILIAVTEAVNNAIIHGNKSELEKNAFVKYLYKDNLIIFCVKDEGSGFDFENLPDPTDPKNIEEPQGRGVFLMKHLSDEITYEEPGNSVELVFQL